MKFIERIETELNQLNEILASLAVVGTLAGLAAAPIVAIGVANHYATKSIAKKAKKDADETAVISLTIATKRVKEYKRDIPRYKKRVQELKKERKHKMKNASTPAIRMKYDDEYDTKIYRKEELIEIMEEELAIAEATIKRKGKD